MSDNKDKTKELTDIIQDIADEAIKLKQRILVCGYIPEIDNAIVSFKVSRDALIVMNTLFDQLQHNSTKH